MNHSCKDKNNVRRMTVHLSQALESKFDNVSSVDRKQEALHYESGSVSEQAEDLIKRSSIMTCFGKWKGKRGYKRLTPSPCPPLSNDVIESQYADPSSSYWGINRDQDEIKQDERYGKNNGQMMTRDNFEAQVKLRVQIRKRLNELKEEFTMIEPILTKIAEVNQASDYQYKCDAFVYGYAIYPEQGHKMEPYHLQSLRTSIERAEELYREQRVLFIMQKNIHQVGKDLWLARINTEECFNQLQDYYVREKELMKTYTEALRSGKDIESLPMTRW